MRFCGTCTKYAKNDSDLMPNEDGVLECGACRTEPARFAHGPERGYDCDREGGGGPILARATAAANRIAGPAYPRNRYLGSQMRAGHVVIRVPQCDAQGKPIDHEAAYQSLRDQPWFASVKSLGLVNGYFLFQLPVPKAIKDDRTGLEAIEEYRVKGDA